VRVCGLPVVIMVPVARVSMRVSLRAVYIHMILIIINTPVASGKVIRWLPRPGMGCAGVPSSFMYSGRAPMILCVYVCVYVCVCVCVYTYIHTYIHILLHVCMYVCMRLLHYSTTLCTRLHTLCNTRKHIPSLHNTNCQTCIQSDENRLSKILSSSYSIPTIKQLTNIQSNQNSLFAPKPCISIQPPSINLYLSFGAVPIAAKSIMVVKDASSCLKMNVSSPISPGRFRASCPLPEERISPSTSGNHCCRDPDGDSRTIRVSSFRWYKNVSKLSEGTSVHAGAADDEIQQSVLWLLCIYACLCMRIL
jgi:hypothetical protein